MGLDTGLNTEKKINMSEQSEIKASTVIELACQATTARDTAKTPGLGMIQGSCSTALTPGLDIGRKIIMSEQLQRQTSPDIELAYQASTVTDS
jgi:hypothetical protein